MNDRCADQTRPTSLARERGNNPKGLPRAIRSDRMVPATPEAPPERSAVHTCTQRPPPRSNARANAAVSSKHPTPMRGKQSVIEGGPKLLLLCVHGLGSGAIPQYTHHG